MAVIAVSVCSAKIALSADGFVELGTALPLTGAYERSGADTKNGYDLAIRQLNAKGGIDVRGKRYYFKLRYYDDRSDPISAQEQVERLIHADGVNFILGPYRGGRNLAVLSTVERHRIPMVDAHSVVQATGLDSKRYSFAVAATPSQYLSAAVRFAASISDKFGKQVNDLRIALATNNDPFSREVREGALSEAKRLGMTSIIDDQFANGSADISGTLDRIKELKPDLFLVSGHESAAKSTVLQIERSGAKVPMVALTHCRTARLAEEQPGASAKVFCPAEWAPKAPYKGVLFGTGEDFAQLYNDAYGHDPSSVAAQAATAIIVFANAMERAQSLETEKVRDAVSATNLMTFLGPIKFDDRGVNRAVSRVLPTSSAGGGVPGVPVID
ncbi:MAG: amino acid ABC transporter substrate-binding protein, partial [Pseudomonadota bacterium]